MRTRVVVASILGLTNLLACRPGTVELTYRFPDGETLDYRMVAEAAAQWDIGEPGRGSYEVVFDVTESVESVDETGAVVSVVMDPREVRENGLPSPGAERRSFRLRLGTKGEVREILEVEGVPASALDPDELLFIGTYRPPLPLEEVALTGDWRSEQQVELDPVFQQLQTLGRLDSLRRDADGRIAELTYSGDGPLRWTTDLPQGEAELTGSAQMTSDAVFDIDGGFLRSGTSTTEGDFEVRVFPKQGLTPVSGTLSLSLELDLALQNAS